MSENYQLRQKMVEICLKMNSSGINQGTAGNLSVCTGDSFLLTPSGLPYDRMTPEDIVEMNFDGSYIGCHRPSSEWRFHRDILLKRQDINAVLHCHSTYATVLASHFRSIPAFHYMVGIFGGNTIRCTPYTTFGTQALSEYALEALKGRKACLLGKHGQIALGKDLDQALHMAIELETLAKMYAKALTLGEPEILSDEEMARVCDQMTRMSYGQAPDPEGVNDVPKPRVA